MRALACSLSYTESGIRCALIGAAGEEAAALVDLSLVPAAGVQVD